MAVDIPSCYFIVTTVSWAYLGIGEHLLRDKLRDDSEIKGRFQDHLSDRPGGLRQIHRQAYSLGGRFGGSLLASRLASAALACLKRAFVADLLARQQGSDS